ncbi:fibronectin type III domain-containing protein [Herbidospora mongoliensis]|uniref:fibronectin type III domain-containing protein n=1 Tax=Herbidospora mongoliensis TaxID=688067 RepID=UPI00082D7187|nr:fibronectin type III domain-containing protein [Herbidospora mongoliensis]
MTFDLRLVAYHPNGARRGLLASPLTFEAGMPLGDVPGLTVGYSTEAPGYEHLATVGEIAVEYRALVTGGEWVEPPDARFMRIGRGGDDVDVTGSREYSCPGYIWQAKKCVLYPPDDLGTLVDGKRPFLGVSPGAILRTFLQEGQGRGTIPGLDHDFTTTHDSAGNAWSHVMTVYMEIGVDLLTVLINLSEQGLIDFRTQGRTLQVYNGDTTLGRDLASGPDPVDLRFGRDVTEAPVEGTYEEAASAILIQGEGSLRVEVENPGADTPWGRWEQYQGQGGVTDEGTAQLLAEEALARAGRERVQLTRGITVEVAEWLPLIDYRPGDHILAPGDGGVMESLRVRQITLTKDEAGVVGGNLVLNDRFLERDIKLARRSAGILGGSAADGGTGVEPAPESPPGRVPAAPEGLIVDPLAYVDQYGFARGQITAAWGLVTEDVSSVAIDVDTYELHARINDVDEPWQQITSTDGGDNTATYSPLSVGFTYAFKVRAVSEGTKGVFSDTLAVLIPNDVTPPPVPTTPTLSTRLGIIYVTWDGQGLNPAPGPMPVDFDHAKIFMTDGVDPAIEIGAFRIGGSYVVAGQPYGEDRTFHLTAVDRAGNESDPSDEATIATVPLVDTDLIGQVVSGANIVDGSLVAAEKIVAESITALLIAAEAIEAGHLSANSVTADAIEAGAVTAAAIAATAIDGKTITGAWIRTAASGQRIELAPPGAAYPEMRFYPNSGANYTRQRTRGDGFTGEAMWEITSGTNAGVTAASQTTIAAGYMQMQVRNAALNAANGGLMELTEDYARYGFFHDASDEQYFWFDRSGRTRHVGRWWDYADLGPTAGILAGSDTVSSGLSGANYTYGSTMTGNMGPVVTVRDGAVTANFYWCLVGSNQSGFVVEWSIGGGVYSGKAVYWWVHRH